MASGTLTTTTHEEFVPEIWSAQTIDAYEKNLVIAGLLENWNPLFAGGGDTALIPVFKNLQRTDVQDIPETKQALFDPQLTDAASVELAIDRKKYASVEISDPLLVFANQDLIGKYTAKLGYALAEYVDYDMAQIYSSSAHSAVDLTGLDAKSDADIIDALNTAVRYFDDQDLPQEGRAFVLNPKLYAAIRATDQFSSADFTGSQAMTTGVLGSIFGVPVYMSTSLRTTSVSGSDVTHCLLLHREAVAWADPQPITTKLAGSDGRFVHAQVTATIYYGWISAPHDGTNNYGVVDIQVS
ncbi:MAG: phage capsid protein [Candidatus Lernaella stagnicola]|nr:phage capsid protein [Candidatus Lernaella stagnicola]